ncbi:hypothetical protein [Methylobacterium sp. 37f]|uniref:hypothetical protein n=1 Tax=Methylobacterium sp. 37f TaxID=2817058 RepID=UPI001FFD06B3|nr:hypothetical protein [Methylobacterium sp. 37f]
MARKQNSSSFDTRSFDGVEMTTDLGASIEAWKERFVSTVGMAKYRRAFGWAVDETAKAATIGIRAKFDKHLKRQAPWTKSAVAYKRLSKSDLNGLENGARDVEDVYAQVFVKAKQSTYLKYMFGMGNNVRTPGDVGLAQDHILLPWWDNITLTQGVRPTAGGGVPVSLLAQLHREMQAGKATKGKGRSSSRWGVYYGPVTVHGQSHMAYVARPPRVPVTEHDVLHRGAKALDAVIVRRNGDIARVGRKMRDSDHPRILFLAVDRATYQPKLQAPWDEACREAAARIPDIMAAQLKDNIDHRRLSELRN